MKDYTISAFSDEYSSSLDLQIEGLVKNGIKYMEIRNVDGRPLAEHTLPEVKQIKKKLDANGIRLSAIGSPLGKIKLTDDFEEHMKLLKHFCDMSEILECDRIRMFSFYYDKDTTAVSHRDEVMYRLDRMLAYASKAGKVLCHENEAGIYGCHADECLDIQNEFGGEIKCVFDPANFILNGDTPYPDDYELLKDKITYFHIKDAFSSGEIVPAGQGEGRIAETLADYKKNYGCCFVTLEPHLMIFKGLTSLADISAYKMKNTYKDGKEAFCAAADALKGILEKIKD